MNETVQELLDNKLIEPSKSAWCSPVMIVKQRTREGKVKYRFICDNRALNEITIKDAHSLIEWMLRLIL